MAGTSLRTASRTSSSSGLIQGRSSCTLIGPPMKARPENLRTSLGTARPSSSGISFHGIVRRCRYVAKYAGPSLRTGLPALAGPAARAAEVTLVGVFGDKAAVLAIDGGAPRTVKVGQKLGGVTVIAVQKDRATIESGGKRRGLG